MMLSWEDEIRALTPGAARAMAARPAVAGQAVATDESEAAAILERRVNAADKSIINGQTDNKKKDLFNYKWAWEKYLARYANLWMPQEINMSRDISQWKNPNGLTE